EKFGRNDEVGVYRDCDSDEIDNDIVINGVNVERGKKLNKKKEGLDDLRKFNDEVCGEDGLRVGEKDRGGLGYREREKGIGEGNRK
ncbi:relaxase/mobilization nuclease domain-containing protein, partial [Staphylococcus epidermidis]|uniref:relaxase/mobilization nuclease domain-containing protein n=1 Tax=Staphylococcus epidermidis TaxID=1282 RepID=UPI001642C18E